MSVTISPLPSDIDVSYLEASYGGIPFYIETGDDEAGRRSQRFLFPGEDASGFQDLGEMDGDIEIKGALIGDDYIQQAQAMRAVFTSPGPQVLQHPWLGEIVVVQKPGRLPKFSFSQGELRVARFTLAVLLYAAPDPPAPDTATAVDDAAGQVQDAAAAFLSVTLAPGVLTVAAIGAVQGFVNTVAAQWGVLTASARDAAVAPAAVAPIAAMGTVATVTVDATYGTNIAGLLGGVPAAIAGTSAPILPAAVAPGGSTAAPVAVDPRVTATAILQVLPSMAGYASAMAPGPALSLAAQALALSYAVTAASDIAFTSQQEARAWFAQLAAALEAAASLAQSLVAQQPEAAGGLWRTLVALQGALAADMTAEIGRLPAVQILTLTAPQPLWLVAYYLAGGTLALVLPTYLDLAQRNGVVNPAIPPPGPLEVLVQ